MATNTIIDNKVVQAKATDLLTTKVNTKSLLTVDNSLVGAAGKIVTINTYTYTGTAEELAEGAGNSTDAMGYITTVSKDYTVKRVQQPFSYNDDEAMRDPLIVDTMLNGATQKMANKMTTDFYSTLATTNSSDQELVSGITFPKTGALSYDVIVDAISELNVEDESNVFVIIPNAWKAALRKDNDYKSAMQGEVIYTGQVGTICGKPVVATKALTDKAYVLTKEAVTLFMKKDVIVESDRNIDTTVNDYRVRTYYVMALTNADKACKITKATD